MARRRRKGQDAYDDAFDAMRAHERFIDLVADGTPEINAALEVGWTPRQMHGYLQDKSYAELVIAARDRADGTIEQVLFQKAKAGSPWAVKMWLENRKSGSWQSSSTQRIEVRTSASNTEMVGAVREGVLAILAQVGAKEMQALPAVIDVQSYEVDDEPEPD